MQIPKSEWKDGMKGYTFYEDFTDEEPNFDQEMNFFEDLDEAIRTARTRFVIAEGDFKDKPCFYISVRRSFLCGPTGYGDIWPESINEPAEYLIVRGPRGEIEEAYDKGDMKEMQLLYDHIYEISEESRTDYSLFE